MGGVSSIRVAVSLAVLAIGLDSGTRSLQSQATIPELEREVARIAAAAPAQVGVAITHVETQRTAFVNGDEWFPMASTYKIPIALTVLNRVERGSLRLDSLVPLEPADIVPFGSLLTERFGDSTDPGVTLSVRRYLELMLVSSDNTATDVLLRTIGGTPAVMARLAELGASNIEVTHTVMELGATWLGFDLPPRSERTVVTMRRLMEQVKPEQVATSSRAFLASHHDHATPRAVAGLLVRIINGNALASKSRDLLLDLMTRDETGKNRLRGFLPPGVKVSSKTGTIQGNAENDVGVIFLPDGSHLVVAAYTKNARAEPRVLERVIADIGRTAYDFFAMERNQPRR